MSSIRTTVTLEPSTAEEARRLGVNVSAAARRGVEAAVHAARIETDRRGYQAQPEQVDSFWDEAEAWGEE